MEVNLQGESLLVTVRRWPSHAKEWVARVRGPHQVYDFDRDYCPVFARDWSRSGKHGTTTFEVTEPGYYQVSDPATGKSGEATRSFWHWDRKEWRPATKEEVLEVFYPAEVAAFFRRP